MDSGFEPGPPSTTTLSRLPWDVIAEVFDYLGTEEVAIFARSCQVHYCLAHGYLWRNPKLTLTQAMMFLRYVYRRPLVTTALPPHLDQLVQRERPETVNSIELVFYRQDAAMDELMLDSALSLLKYCDGAKVTIGVKKERKRHWIRVTAKHSARISIVGYEEYLQDYWLTEEKAAEAREAEPLIEEQDVHSTDCGSDLPNASTPAPLITDDVPDATPAQAPMPAQDRSLWEILGDLTIENAPARVDALNQLSEIAAQEAEQKNA